MDCKFSCLPYEHDAVPTGRPDSEVCSCVYHDSEGRRRGYEIENAVDLMERPGECEGAGREDEQRDRLQRALAVWQKVGQKAK